MPSEGSHLWLGAEALAALLTGEAAFRHALTALEHNRGILSGATEEVDIEVQEWLRPRARGGSLNALRRHREHVWFGEEFASHRTLEEILTAAACEALDHRGSKVMLKAASAEKAAVWRSLSLAVPADLLAAALCAKCHCDPPSDLIDVSGPHIRKLLDSEPGACETHMHVGAAFSFPVLWSSLMHVIAGDECKLDTIRTAAVPFGSAPQFVGRLLQAGIARLVLAAFLWHRSTHDDSLTFEQFLTRPPAHPVSLAAICERIAWAAGPLHARDSIRAACRDLAVPVLQPIDLAALRHLYDFLIGEPPPARPGDPIDTVIAADPLCWFYRDRRSGESPETVFTTRAFEYLLAHANDELFRQLFWQYERVRCRTFRYLTQEPGTAGLDWFTEHYTRISAVREALENALYRSALDLQSTGLRLGAMEARTSPASSRHEVTAEVRKLAQQALQRNLAMRRVGKNEEDLSEVGLVLHFIKDRKWNEQHSGDPSGTGWRFGGWFRDARNRAIAMQGALHERPELLMLLRGMDVANHELAIPTWAVLPIMKRLREVSAVVAARMRSRAPFWSCEPLAITFHAGEDFRRLVEGLRRIHEPVEFGLLQPGDRIGHGVALGTDAESRRVVERMVVQPREERLFDLLWELTRYAEGDFEPDRGRIEVARADALKHGRALFGDADVSVDQLLQLRRDLHDPDTLIDVLEYGGPSVPPATGHPRWDLAARYLTAADVFLNAIAPVSVEHDPSETAMLIQAQKFLRRKLGRLEITIESNPSSNLLIGDFVSLDEHPAFRIQPLRNRRDDDDGAVLLSVNTDNPITFATRLADEFAYLYYALIRSDVTADDALAWVGARRDDGWRSRFTLRESKLEQVLRIVAMESSFEAEEALARLRRGEG